ncbi:MAG: hypothetical protein ABI995_03725 [Acidobacteriota bacterium]
MQFLILMGMFGLILPVAGQDSGKELLAVKRVFVDRLTGGETAAQMRDLMIASLHNSKLFVITEDPERADAFLRGAAEDLIFTDQFSSKDGVNMRAATGAGTRSSSSTNLANRGVSVMLGEDESLSRSERKHEAMAAVRLVNKAGDVIWSTTQESNGAKFRGASADVADKVTKQLQDDMTKARRP